MVTGCLDDETMLGLVEGRLGGKLAAAEEHLDGCQACREVVASMAKLAAPPSSTDVIVRGQRIGPGGRYVIGDLLGSGAMGHVYAAHQPELDRKVAIKILRDDSGATSDRLLREAQAMAKLDHPNVVGVHEVGTLADGAVFVAMDLVEGETLRTWMIKKRAIAEVVRVLIEVARGLAAVHAAGVIHRDIKPDNIIVGGDGRARLGDFGLARGGGMKMRAGRLADSASFDDTQVATPLTAANVRAAATPAMASGTSVAGTPVYMAPEALRGGAATPASDQFAFGVTAYEILDGNRPFTGGTWEALIRAIERTPPPLRDAPSWLDAAIRRCLDVDPAARFSSMSALADHLAERSQRRKPIWLAGVAGAAVIASGVTFVMTRGGTEPVGPVCTAGATEIAGTWNPGVRDRLGALGAPTLAALDGWATRWASEHDATCGAATTAPAPNIAARQQCLVRQRTELAALLARVEPAKASPERMLDAVAALAPADCQFAEPNAADPVPADPDHAKAVRTVERGLPAARAAIALGDARPVLETTRQLLDTALASTHLPTVAETQLVRSDALRAAAELEAAALAARDALTSAERGHDDQAAARAWLARIAIALDRRELAIADDQVAVAEGALDRARATPRQRWQLVKLRAQIAYNRGRYDQAMMLADNVHRDAIKLSGEHSVDVAQALSALGTIERARGNLLDAESYHRKALAIDRELRGDKHPDVARDLHNIAGVLRLRGDLDGAHALYTDALAIEVAIRGAHSPQAGLTHNSLGLIALARKDYPTARTEFTAAREALATAGTGDRAFAEHNLGLLAAATGDHETALAQYDKAAELFAQTLGADAASAIRLHLDRARSLLARGKRDKGIEEARRAVEQATAAGLAWIADDAKALIPGPASPKPRPAVAIEPPPGSSTKTTPTVGSRSPDAPVPDPPKPTPRRDVGSYGAGQP